MRGSAPDSRQPPGRRRSRAGRPPCHRPGVGGPAALRDDPTSMTWATDHRIARDDSTFAAGAASASHAPHPNPNAVTRLVCSCDGDLVARRSGLSVPAQQPEGPGGFVDECVSRGSCLGCTRFSWRSCSRPATRPRRCPTAGARFGVGPLRTRSTHANCSTCLNRSPWNSAASTGVSVRAEMRDGTVVAPAPRGRPFRAIWGGDTSRVPSRASALEIYGECSPSRG